MAEQEEPPPATAAVATETKKMINSSRAEIDTSPPFESVKEAVVRFGGRGPWIPPPPLQDDEVLDVDKIEEHTMKYERDLMKKEEEALDVLKEVEAAKRFVEGLKVNLMEEISTFVNKPNLTLENTQMKRLNGPGPVPVQSLGYVLMELDQAKLDLNKMSVDLAVIRTSVESLNDKMRKEKALIEKSGEQNPLQQQCDNSGGSIVTQHHQQDVVDDVICMEVQQFKTMAEASRYEVMKAMSEIERTKASIKIAEMRLVAAKKMEEAAKAVEAVAFAEKKATLNSNKSNTTSAKDQGITLPYEEYYALTRKAQQADEQCNTKFIDSREIKKPDNDNTNASSGTGENRATECRKHHVPVFRSSSISIGDILGRKLILQDDVMVGDRVERSHCSGTRHVSFSQMLREQSGIILNPAKSTKDESVQQKQYIAHRKRFGFIHIPISNKNNKKKSQSLKKDSIFE